MTNDNTLVCIDFESCNQLFISRNVSQVVLVGSQKTWIMQFYATNPVTHENTLYTIQTQRGKIRTWSDPRSVFQQLRHWEIHECLVQIKDVYSIVEFKDRL